jgi:AacA4 family aminoglycoside N(6')-acetyltransferase
MTDIRLRRMVEADLPLLHDWLNRPHIVEWWGGEQPSFDKVRDHYLPYVRGELRVTPFIGLLDGQPFAYAQSYVAMGWGGGWWENETDPGVRGIDQCVALPDRLNQGLGTLLVRTLVAQLFRDPAVTRVQTDPALHNARAIRCYEKAGFRRIGEVLTPDGPALYMLHDRPAVESAAPRSSS